MSVRYRQAVTLAASCFVIQLSGCVGGDDTSASPASVDIPASKELESSVVLDSPRGPVALHVSAGGILDASFQPVPAEAPATFSYPVDFIAVDIGGLAPGATVQLTVALPADIEPDAYVKCVGDRCEPFSGGVLTGNTVILTLVDGGAGDNDGVADGVIRDPGAPAYEDTDSDGVLNYVPDNCLLIPNADQADFDLDGMGDICDMDDDNDGALDLLDGCRTDPGETQDLDRDGTCNNADLDDDGDGIADATDNCPQHANADQLDFDRDGIGNVCDATLNLPRAPISLP